MIVYLLTIIFFVLLVYNQNDSFNSFDSFVDYKSVYRDDKEHKIYKGMYKCADYEDIRLN
jgi:hypothetical protein